MKDKVEYYENGVIKIKSKFAFKALDEILVRAIVKG